MESSGVQSGTWGTSLAHQHGAQLRTCVVGRWPHQYVSCGQSDVRRVYPDERRRALLCSTAASRHTAAANAIIESIDDFIIVTPPNIARIQPVRKKYSLKLSYQISRFM